MSIHRRRLITGATAGCLIHLAAPTQAAGFAIIEQGVTGLGNAYAGGAASAEDASTIFYNPAGMILVPNSQFVGALHVISPTTNFDGSATVGGVVPVTGGDGGEAGETGLVPNFYYVRALESGLKLGLGINAPFGLATEYDAGWEGRYHALRSELRTVNFNPALAFKLGERLSLGAGINLQYIDVPELSQAIDFATVCSGLAIGACAGLPTTNDGRVKLGGDDWSWGYNFGLLYEFSEQTRLGFAYRSKIDHELEGTADFTGTPTALQALGVFVDDDVTADISVPETASLSLYHNLNPRLAIMGDVTWTRWSRFQELRVQFETNPQSDLVTPEQWDDSLRYAVGLTYDYDDRWILRTGVAFDETPIPSAELRTPRIPGNDRRWLAVGASYRHSRGLFFDFGYAHLFISDTPINNTNSTGAILTGTYQSSVDILSGQVRWAFD